MCSELLGCRVLKLSRPSYTSSRLLTRCRECGAEIDRSYAAVYCAGERGCVCSRCHTTPIRTPRKLHPYLERIVERLAKTLSQATAMRALLSCVAEDEPVRVSSREFWDALGARLVKCERPVSLGVARSYVSRAKSAAGIGARS